MAKKPPNVHQYVHFELPFTTDKPRKAYDPFLGPRDCQPWHPIKESQFPSGLGSIALGKKEIPGSKIKTDERMLG